jgi:hypothetical protein
VLNVPVALGVGEITSACAGRNRGCVSGVQVWAVQVVCVNLRVGADEKRGLTEEGEGVMTERWNKESSQSVIPGIHQVRVGSAKAGGEGECHDDDAIHMWMIERRLKRRCIHVREHQQVASRTLGQELRGGVRACHSHAPFMFSNTDVVGAATHHETPVASRRAAFLIMTSGQWESA